MRASRWLAALATAAFVALPAAAAAQSSLSRGYLFQPPKATLTLYGGFAQPTAASDVWSQSFDELTLGRADFGTRDIGADLAFHLSARTDVVVSVASSGLRRRSNFREWVDNAGSEIEQTTRFVRMPIGAGVRRYLRDRGHMIGSRAWVPTSLVPYVGAAIGGMRYRFVQYGDFIDPSTLNVFRDEFEAEGIAPYVQASTGAGWTILPELQLVGDLRYTYARGKLGRDFVGFDKIDLSGLTTAVGLSLRF